MPIAQRKNDDPVAPKGALALALRDISFHYRRGLSPDKPLIIRGVDVDVAIVSSGRPDSFSVAAPAGKMADAALLGALRAFGAEMANAAAWTVANTTTIEDREVPIMRLALWIMILVLIAMGGLFAYQLFAPREPKVIAVDIGPDTRNTLIEIKGHLAALDARLGQIETKQVTDATFATLKADTKGAGEALKAIDEKLGGAMDANRDGSVAQRIGAMVKGTEDVRTVIANLENRVKALDAEDANSFWKRVEGKISKAESGLMEKVKAVEVKVDEVPTSLDRLLKDQESRVFKQTDANLGAAKSKMQEIVERLDRIEKKIPQQ